MDLDAFTKLAQDEVSVVLEGKKILEYYTKKQKEWENGIKQKTNAWYESLEFEFKQLLSEKGYQVSGGKSDNLMGTVYITTRAEFRENKFCLSKEQNSYRDDIWNSVEITIRQGEKQLHHCFIEPKIISNTYKSLPNWEIKFSNLYETLTWSGSFDKIKKYLDNEASVDTANEIISILNENINIIESNINNLESMTIGSEVEGIGDVSGIADLITKL